MKSRLTYVIFTLSLLLFFNGIGICQEKSLDPNLVDKVGQAVLTGRQVILRQWASGSAEKLASKINARPIALRAAQVDALRNLLEITQGVQVDSVTSIKDFTVGSNVIDTQVSGLVKGAEVLDHQYLPDGRAEVRLRMPLYGRSAKIIISLAMAKTPAAPVPSESLSAPSVKILASPSAPVVYTGIVIDARGIQARPAMLPRIFDEDGREVYGLANVDREYAEKQGISSYARDLHSTE